MALGTPTWLNNSSNTTNNTTITSGSISPTANSLLIIVESNRTSAGARTVSSVSDTLTGTGTWSVDEENTGTASGYVTTSICTAQVGSSPGSGTITVTLSDASARKTLQVFEITGHNTTTPVKQSNGNTGTSSTLSITLSASPDSDSCVIGSVTTAYDGAGSGVTPGGNYTEVNDYDPIFGAGNIVVETEYDSTPTSTTVDWSSLNTINNSGSAVEIDAAGAATPAPSVQDDVDVSESITAAVSAGIASIQDDATIAETVTARLLSFISAQDDATIAELITAAVSDPQIDITENATVAELVAALVSSPQITITDDATLTEDVTVTVTGGADVAAYINISPSANYIQVVTP